MRRLVDWLVELSGVLVVFVGALFAEQLVVANLHGNLLTGTWETVAMRTLVLPIAVSMLLPMVLAAVLVARVARHAEDHASARRLLSGGALIAGAATAWGVSSGRMLASPPLRTSFVLVVAIAAGAAVFALLPRVVAMPKARLATSGLALGAAAWAADKWLLPRLYPAFHSALFVVCLAGVAAAVVALPLAHRWTRRALMLAAALIVAFSATARTRARRLASYDNLRLVLVERAPLMGRAVRFAASLAPQEAALDDGAKAVPTAAPTLGPHLDFRGRDILLVSVDALRADHVGAYGYRRPTTPRIDQLAAEGARFGAAYSPTPHTSYAVTSMLTGKYLRPLVTLGLGGDSETWAGLLRHYGYRTAAFYPPAVFFIDEALFAGFRDRHLDFEYQKMEFASAAERVTQAAQYLERAPAEQPVFLWVHLFEPHEPYVAHAEHRFGDGASPRPVDAYDSEIASSDHAVGKLVELVRRRRRDPVIIVTADHGEEFGDHGGRYHGTTVYDEQVRVPLVVVGAGIPARVVSEPVQTIDLLPTVLSALRVPRPARVRGRDLTGLLAGTVAEGEGFAFSETEDRSLVAVGRHRLLCERRIGACALYDIETDPGQTRDRGAAEPSVVAALKGRGADLARSHGRLERGDSAALPESLRRALTGDREVALDVAPLLDDVRVDLRRAAARALFELQVADTAPFAVRAFGREDDDETKRWLALALVRLGADAPEARARTEGLLSAEGLWPARAALAFAEIRDGRGVLVLASCLERPACRAELGFVEQRASVRAMAKLRDKRAVPSLVLLLTDVRLRGFAAEALGEIGDRSAKGALLASFAAERYVSLRASEARALSALGAGADMEEPLRRFLGVPEPWADGMRIAIEAGVAKERAAGPLRVQEGARAYVVVKGPDGGQGGLLSPPAPLQDGEVSVYEADPTRPVLNLVAPAYVLLVPRVDELPPPAPIPWDGGAGSETLDGGL